MIYFYSGTPGSGKSLHVAQEIYDSLRCGKNVIANFQINEKAVKPLWRRKKGSFICVDNWELNTDGLIGFANNFHKKNADGNIIEGQTLLILDECQLIFNARSWNEKGRNLWNSFFTQHRKYGYDVILVSQFDRLVDRQIRSLIEYELKHRKINNFKFFGQVLGLLSGGALFCYVTYWYGVKEKINVTFFRGQKRYYNLYNSYKLFENAS
ncbi:MAG: zonular occludens toxin domain-containing protein [Lachnospiraceae bacterium]|nr:zonular occludens toxin domain-containing protein [Lachnospiraceae bacterium]